MPRHRLLSSDERRSIEHLIDSFDNHGCGLGLDVQAQKALRRLLEVLSEAERTIDALQGAAQE